MIILDYLIILCHIFLNLNPKEENMAFKKIESKIGFAELAFSSSMDKNRTLKTLEQMNKVIDWDRIDKILKKTV